MNRVYLTIQLLLAAAVLWASFCRLVHTSSETAREIRWAFFFEFVAAGFVLGAPVLPVLMPDLSLWKPWTTPRWVWTALLGSMCVSNLATARYWLTGRAQERFRQATGAAVRPFWSRLGLAAAVLLVAFTVSSPQMALAQAGAPQWERVESPLVLLEPGTTFHCAHASGCVVAAPEVLQDVLAKIAATCSRSPRGAL